MGKLGSFTQEEMDRKKADNKNLVKIWEKTMQVQQAKKNLHSTQELLIDATELQQNLAATHKEIQTVTNKLNQTLKSDESGETRAQTVFDNLMRGAAHMRLVKTPGTPLNHSVKRNTSTAVINRKRTFVPGEIMSLQNRSNSNQRDSALSLPQAKSHADGIGRKLETQDNTNMLANLASKIQAKPQTSKARTNPILSNCHEDGAASDWSKIVNEIAHDDQNRAEHVNKKMDRKRIVAEEQRFRRGQPTKS